MIGDIGRIVVETSRHVVLLTLRSLCAATGLLLLVTSICHADDATIPPADPGTETTTTEPIDTGADPGTETTTTEPVDTGAGTDTGSVDAGGGIASENGTPADSNATGVGSSETPPGDPPADGTSSGEVTTTSTDPATDPNGNPIPVVTTVGPELYRFEVMSLANGDFNIPYVVVCPPLDLEPSLSSYAASPNQRAVATALDNVVPRIPRIYDYAQPMRIAFYLPGPAGVIAHEIQGLPTQASQQAALNSLSGEVYGTLQSLGLQIGDRSLRIVSDRIINNDIFLNYGDAVLVSDRGGSGGTGMGSGSQFTSDPLVVRGQYSSSAITGWVQGYGNSGGWGSNGNAAAADYRLGGVSYGVDLGRDETGAIGITGGNSFTSYNTDLQDQGRVTSYQIGVYLVKRIESAYLFSILNYGRNNYSVNRQVNIGGVIDTPQSRFHGDMLTSYSELGWNLDWPSTRFQPFFGFQTMSLSNSRANESGTTGLNVAASNLNSARTHLGGRLIAPALIDDLGIQWTPYMSARWVSDLAGQSPNASVALSSGPAGASWTVAGNQSGRNFGMFGFGLNAQVTDRLSLFGNYDYQTAARFHSHTGSGGLAFEF